jgi:hypothetical protein
VKLEFSRPIFEKYSNIKYNENPSMGTELVCAGGRTAMPKPIVPLCNLPNAPKKGNMSTFQPFEVFFSVYVSAYIYCVNGTWNKAWYAAFNSRRCNVMQCVLYDSALLTKFISHRWFLDEWLWGTDGKPFSSYHSKSHLDWPEIGPSRWDAGD